ncbi:MAG: hypothetical protein CM15mL2_0130 [Caudoviricetes sp.]|nr:MAG: hypothetical protein CM15mL2_0130 [Caudoviricetes sp.]
MIGENHMRLMMKQTKKMKHSFRDVLQIHRDGRGSILSDNK